MHFACLEKSLSYQSSFLSQLLLFESLEIKGALEAIKSWKRGLFFFSKKSSWMREKLDFPMRTACSPAFGLSGGHIGPVPPYIIIHLVFFFLLKSMFLFFFFVSILFQPSDYVSQMRHHQRLHAVPHHSIPSLWERGRAVVGHGVVADRRKGGEDAKGRLVFLIRIMLKRRFLSLSNQHMGRKNDCRVKMDFCAKDQTLDPLLC